MHPFLAGVFDVCVESMTHPNGVAGNMLQTSIYEDEGWDEYRQRTKLISCLVDSDEDGDA